MHPRFSIPGCFVSLVILMHFTPASLGAAKDEYPESVALGGKGLILNGTATRSVFGIRVYDVGLYVSDATDDDAKIMRHNHDPKRLKIVMLRSVSDANFVSAVRDNLDKNLTASEQAAFAEELAVFFKTFGNGTDLKEGSEITIDYLPSEGMVISVDGEKQAVIPGRDFYHAILRLWIGSPLQSSIKSGLLSKGQPQNQ